MRSLFKRIQRAQTKLSGEVDAPTSRQKLLSKKWNLFCLVHTCAPTEDFLGADNISVYTIHEFMSISNVPPPLEQVQTKVPKEKPTIEEPAASLVRTEPIKESANFKQNHLQVRKFTGRVAKSLQTN